MSVAVTKSSAQRVKSARFKVGNLGETAMTSLHFRSSVDSFILKVFQTRFLSSVTYNGTRMSNTAALSN